MTLVWERGSEQREETKRFPMGPQITTAEINETYERTSGFYHDKKKSVWLEKWCSLHVGYYNGPKWIKVASKKVNMGPYVEQEQADVKVELTSENKHKALFSEFAVEVNFKITRSEN